jgi:hypothetical protein
MSDTVIRRAAFSLSPDRPIRMLALLSHAPRSTARSWATGRRRPRVVILQMLRDKLKARHAALLALIFELEYLIAVRESEPRRRTGFNEIKERDGPGSIARDGRNRLGRPRAARTA